MLIQQKKRMQIPAGFFFSFSFFDFTLRTEVLKYFGLPLDLMQWPKRIANATVKQTFLQNIRKISDKKKNMVWAKVLATK